MNRHQCWERWLWAGALSVLAYRALALVYPHAALTDPEPVRLALTPLGLWFLGCGLWAFHRAPGSSTLLFAGYGLTGGIHWGGPFGLGPDPVQNLLLAVYVVLSTTLHTSFFLHLAVAFPPPLAAARRTWLRFLVYLPVAAGLLLFVALLFRPSSSTLLGAFGLLFPIGTLYALAALAIWIAGLVRADPATRRARRLALVVATLVLGWLPQALVAAGLTFWPGDDGLASLALAPIPAALAVALTSSTRAGRVGDRLEETEP
jgi:hypothetical protein